MSISKTTFIFLDNYPINVLSDNLSENQITSLFKKVHLKSEDISDDSASRFFKKSIEYRPVRFLIAIFNKKRAIRIMNAVLENYRTEKQRQFSTSSEAGEKLTSIFKDTYADLASSLKNESDEPEEQYQEKEDLTQPNEEDLQHISLENLAEPESAFKENTDLGSDLENELEDSLEENQENRDLTQPNEVDLQHISLENLAEPKETLKENTDLGSDLENELEESLEENQENRDLTQLNEEDLQHISLENLAEPESAFKENTDLGSDLENELEESLEEQSQENENLTLSLLEELEPPTAKATFQVNSVGTSSSSIEQKDENPAEETEEPLVEVVEQELIVESVIEERIYVPPLHPTYRYYHTLPTYLQTSEKFIRYLVTNRDYDKMAAGLSSVTAEYLSTSKQDHQKILEQDHKKMIDSWAALIRRGSGETIALRNSFNVISEFPILEQYEGLLPFLPSVIESYKKFQTENCADDGFAYLKLNSKHLTALLKKKKVKASEVEIQIADLLFPIVKDVMFAIKKGLRTEESRERAVEAWKETADRWRSPFYAGLFAVAKMAERPIKYFLKSSLTKHLVSGEHLQKSNELKKQTKDINRLIHDQQRKLHSSSNGKERENYIKNIEELKGKQSLLIQSLEENMMEEQFANLANQLIGRWIDNHSISKVIECLKIYRDFSIQLSDISLNFDKYTKKQRTEKLKGIRQLIVAFLISSVEGIQQYSKEIAKDNVESRIFTALNKHVVNLAYPENTTNFFHITWDRLFVPLLEEIFFVPNFFQTAPRLLDEVKEQASVGDLKAQFKLGKKYYKRGNSHLNVAEDILGELGDKYHYTKAQLLLADLYLIEGNFYASYRYLTYAVRDQDLPQKDKAEEFERGMHHLMDARNNFKIAEEYLIPLKDHSTLGERAAKILNKFDLQKGDWNEHIRNLIINANSGDVLAMCDLGIELLKMAPSSTRIKAVEAEGIALLERAAKADPPVAKALHALGMYYIYQMNFRVIGREHLKRAAELGFAQAIDDLEIVQTQNK